MQLVTQESWNMHKFGFFVEITVAQSSWRKGLGKNIRSTADGFNIAFREKHNQLANYRFIVQNLPRRKNGSRVVPKQLRLTLITREGNILDKNFDALPKQLLKLCGLSNILSENHINIPFCNSKLMVIKIFEIVALLVFFVLVYVFFAMAYFFAFFTFYCNPFFNLLSSLKYFFQFF